MKRFRAGIRNMNTKPADSVRPLLWKSLAPYNSNHDFKLPKLPLPDLNSTAETLLKSVRALTNDISQIKSFESKINSFLSNEGPNLQQRLLARYKDPELLNWLEQWFDDASYMSYRDSVVVNVSYYYGFNPPSTKLNQSQYAARISHHALNFRKDLFDGKLDPDFLGKGKSPLCMNSYRFMFDACRIPAKPFDYVSVNRQKIGHVAVVRKGNWFKIPATDLNGNPLSINELEKKFEWIINKKIDNQGNLGVLTTRNRDLWSDDRDKILKSDKINGKTLADIETSAFVIALDNNVNNLSDPVEKSKHLWCGGKHGQYLNNRFVDKPLQFIIWNDENLQTAVGGFMGEHSAIDGTPTVRLCEYVLSNINYEPNEENNELIDESLINDLKTPPMELKLNMNNMNQSIDDSKNEISFIVDGQVLSYLRTSYGKSLIKRYGFSPDGYTQMLIQLAYSRLKKSNVASATYEAAQTRSFLNGRTECVRSATVESLKFTQSMNDVNCTNEERKLNFRNAINAHIENMKQAGSGRGCDRHLLGLKKSLTDDETVPELFKDEVFIKSSSWILSTSQITSKYFDTYGWGKVVPNGFGIPYAIHDSYLQFTLTNAREYGNETERNNKGNERNENFKKELIKASIDIMNLFENRQSTL